MTYELAKKLRDAGFPSPDPRQPDGNLEFKGDWYDHEHSLTYAPTHSELIEALGEDLESLYRHERGTWNPNTRCNHEQGRHKLYAVADSPRDALALLWLKLHE